MKKFTAKKLFSFLFIITFSQQLIAQGVGVNNTGAAPHISAMLDVTAEHKGILVPRVALSTNDPNVVPGPANSLLVYNTNLNYPPGQGYYYNRRDENNPEWVRLLTNRDAWSVTGNSGLQATQNFLGTTDNVDLRLVRNNVEGLRIATGGALLAQGTFDGVPPISGAGVRLMWVPRKFSFRAGNVDGAQWDLANIGDGSLGVGNNVQASGEFSTALGNNTLADDFYAIAVGNGSQALGQSSFAGGFNSIASKPYAMAFGNTAKAQGESSFAVGYNSVAGGDYSASIGFSNQANGLYSFAAGDLNKANFESAVALGHGNTAVNLAAVALGYATTASGTSAFAAGNLSNASANYAIAMGNNSKASAINTVALGWNNTASNNSAVAIGVGNTANNLVAVAIGEGNMATGISSTAFGFHTKANNVYSTALGSGTLASGAYSTVIGRNNRALGDFSFAGGDSSTASGDGAIAIGALAKANGLWAVSLGDNTIANGNYSTALGLNVSAKARGSLALGTYNDLSDAPNAASNANDDRIFQIGNGTGPGARSNSVTITRDGRVGINKLTPQALLHLKARTFVGDAWNQHIRMEVDGVATDHGNIIYDTDGMKFRNFGADDQFYFRNSANATTARITSTGDMVIAGNLTENSDIRLKKNIEPLTNILAKLNGIQPIFYNFIDEKSHPSEQQIGFSAQEIEKTFPQLVSKDKEGTLSVNYTKMTAVLLQAIKEQQEQINKLQEQIKKLSKK